MSDVQDHHGVRLDLVDEHGRCSVDHQLADARTRTRTPQGRELPEAALRRLEASIEPCRRQRVVGELRDRRIPRSLGWPGQDYPQGA